MCCCCVVSEFCRGLMSRRLAPYTRRRSVIIIQHQWYTGITKVEHIKRLLYTFYRKLLTFHL